MVATKYTQSVGVKISTGGKIMLYAGIALQIASLALLIVGIFVNQFVLFAFIAVLGIGILLGQLYYAQTIEYNYHYAEDRLIFTKKDVRLRVKTLMTVKFDRIISYESFVDFVKNIGLQGRGGTSHKDVFDKIEEIMNDQFTDLSMYISLTDGYSDIEQEWKLHLWSSYNKIPTYFIITKDGKLLNSFEYTYDTVNQKNPRQIKIKN